MPLKWCLFNFLEPQRSPTANHASLQQTTGTLEKFHASPFMCRAMPASHYNRSPRVMGEVRETSRDFLGVDGVLAVDQYWPVDYTCLIHSYGFPTYHPFSPHFRSGNDLQNCRILL